MSCAPPPPPPPGPPLASLATKSNSSSAGDGRSLLLESIRKGKSLKKTTTNDKSAPVLAGSTGVRSPTSGTGSSTLRTNANNGRQSSDPPPQTTGLGGLFVNGIPKLKATGLPIGQAYQQYRNENDAPKSNSSVNSRLSSSNNVHNTHRNNGSNDSSSGYTNHHSTSSITKVRGPPPQPPGPPPKLINRDPDTANGLVVHARSTSTISLSENSYQNRVSTEDGHHPVHSHGKPSLAPKPPSSIARAQSMRVPKSSISVNEINKNESQFGEADQSEAYRMMNSKNGFPSFHQSQESLTRRNTRSSSPTRIPSNAVSWGSSLNTGTATLRPYNRSHGSPLRPPSTKPPPPPSRGTAMSPPMCPPPPPPTQAPPPPPHRLSPAPPPPSMLQNKHNEPNRSPAKTGLNLEKLSEGNRATTELNPAINFQTNFSNTGAPPTPPIRNSSMRSSNSNKMSSFELRFISYFHNMEEFPSPQPFQHVKKIYNSKVLGKQQAPQPPMKALHQPNRTWQSSETTSKC